MSRRCTFVVCVAAILIAETVWCSLTGDFRAAGAWFAIKGAGLALTGHWLSNRRVRDEQL